MSLPEEANKMRNYISQTYNYQLVVNKIIISRKDNTISNHKIINTWMKNSHAREAHTEVNFEYSASDSDSMCEFSNR